MPHWQAVKLTPVNPPLGLHALHEELPHGHPIRGSHLAMSGGIRLSQLMEVVDERFGKSVTFHTCSSMGMDLDGLLRFLETRNKVRITSGVVYPGGSPACEH